MRNKRRKLGRFKLLNWLVVRLEKKIGVSMKLERYVFVLSIAFVARCVARELTIVFFRSLAKVINEEGLPMFDIHEELPAELEVPVVEEEKKEKEPEMPKQQMRYLIKKGGKQVVRTSSRFAL